MDKIILNGSATYLSKYGYLKDDTLRYLMLNLPYRCNYKCLKCCNYEDNIFKKSKFNFSISEIEELIAEASSIGIKVLILAGEGETFLDSDFRNIIELASKYNLIPYIFTNGSKLDTENIAFLFHHKASLIISLDSMDATKYSILTGNGKVEDVIKNINECRSIYGALINQYGKDKIVSLAINMVVTKINIDEIDRIRDFCANDIVFVCNQPTCIGSAEKHWEMLYNTEFSYKDIDNIVNLYSKENGPLGSDLESNWCLYLKNGVSIGADGNILACAYSLESSSFYGHYEKGKLKEYNKLVLSSVNNFYSRYGHSRCLLRHRDYKNFIKINKSKMVLVK